MTNQKKRLGDLLLGAGLVTEDQLRMALSRQKAWGRKLGSALVRLGWVKEEDLVRCLSAQLGFPSVDFSKVKSSPRALRLIPRGVAEKYTVFPIAVKETTGRRSLVLAMADPTNAYTISEIQFRSGIVVSPAVAAESAIHRAIDEHYRKQKPPQGPTYRSVSFSEAEAAGEMVILHRDGERRVGALDSLDAGELVRLLLRVLEEKGVVRPTDVEAALRTLRQRQA